MKKETEYLALTPEQYDIVMGKPFPCVLSEAALVVVTASGIVVKALMNSFDNADMLAYRLNNLGTCS